VPPKGMVLFSFSPPPGRLPSLLFLWCFFFPPLLWELFRPLSSVLGTSGKREYVPKHPFSPPPPPPPPEKDQQLLPRLNQWNQRGMPRSFLCPNPPQKSNQTRDRNVCFFFFFFFFGLFLLLTVQRQGELPFFLHISPLFTFFSPRPLSQILQDQACRPFFWYQEVAAQLKFPYHPRDQTPLPPLPLPPPSPAWPFLGFLPL